MNVLAFIVFAVGVAYLLWAAAAVSRRVDRYYARRGRL